MNLALQSIVETKIFQETDDVEIVVSDNASTDETPALMERYVDLYHKKIKYQRNSNNIYDKNFEIVLSLGTGVFRKLSNDNIIYSEESLAYIVDIITKNSIKRPLLFFLNGSFYSTTQIIRQNALKSFLDTVSYISTWIGGFGIWDTQLKYIEKCSDYHSTQLLQVKIIYEILKDNPDCLIITQQLFDLIPIKNKASYDVLKVFGYNYINILLEYKEYIPNRTIEAEKKRVLYGHIIPYYFDFRKQRLRADSYGYCYLYKTYKRNWYFYFLPITLALYFIYYKVQRIISPSLRSKVRSLVVK